MSGKRKKGRPTGQTLGAIIVGFDQQIFRTMPPVQELIVKGQPIRGLSGQDGSDLQVVFPGDVLDPVAEPDAPEPVDRSTDAAPDR